MGSEFIEICVVSTVQFNGPDPSYAFNPRTLNTTMINNTVKVEKDIVTLLSKEDIDLFFCSKKNVCISLSEEKEKKLLKALSVSSIDCIILKEDMENYKRFASVCEFDIDKLSSLMLKAECSDENDLLKFEF